MTTTDKQRIDVGDEWKVPDAASPLFIRSADMMHWLLMRRVDELRDYEDGSAEAGEREAIADVLEVYEAVRWPEGKIPDGKASSAN
jgi:hypothetical protein